MTIGQFHNGFTAYALPLARIKVMLIDDSFAAQNDGEVLLSQAGCRVMLAEDSFDGLSKIAHWLPDIIFVAANMPHLDGYQICALIRKHLSHMNIPVVLLVNDDQAADPERARQAGTELYLAKPFSREQLLAMVLAHCTQTADKKKFVQIKNLLQIT